VLLLSRKYTLSITSTTTTTTQLQHNYYYYYYNFATTVPIYYFDFSMMRLLLGLRGDQNSVIPQVQVMRSRSETIEKTLEKGDHVDLGRDNEEYVKAKHNMHPDWIYNPHEKTYSHRLDPDHRAYEKTYAKPIQDDEMPATCYHLHPLEAVGDGNDLYINGRGGITLNRADVLDVGGPKQQTVPISKIGQVTSPPPSAAASVNPKESKVHKDWQADYGDATVTYTRTAQDGTVYKSYAKPIEDDKVKKGFYHFVPSNGGPGYYLDEHDQHVFEKDATRSQVE